MLRMFSWVLRFYEMQVRSLHHSFICANNGRRPQCDRHICKGSNCTDKYLTEIKS